MNYSSGVVFRLSLAKGEGWVRVCIAGPKRWKTPHLNPLPFVKGERRAGLERRQDIK
jgi:hypothetical protein